MPLVLMRFITVVLLGPETKMAESGSSWLKRFKARQKERDEPQQATAPTDASADAAHDREAARSVEDVIMEEQSHTAVRRCWT
jgi:Sec-independent protein translocase protein TatA